MPYTFFFVSIAAAWILLAISIYFRSLYLNNIIIGIAAIAFSLVYDIVLGSIIGLYHYVSPRESILYTVLAAVLIYAPLNIVYTLFLPEKRQASLIYTGLWIAAMLLFEYASVIVGTVVFTGWRPIPWSIITYFITYVWVYYFYRYLTARGFGSNNAKRMYRH